MSERTQNAPGMALDWDSWYSALPAPKRLAVDGQVNFAPDPKAQRVKMTNIAFIAEREALPYRTVAENYETARASHAVRQGWSGDAGSNDATFHSFVTDQAARERDESVMLSGIPGDTAEAVKLWDASLTKAALDFGMGEGATGAIGADTDTVKAFQGWYNRASKSPAFRPENASAYWYRWWDLAGAGAKDREIAQAAAEGIFPVLQGLENKRGVTAYDAAPFIRGLTPNQLALTQRQIAVMASKKGGGKSAPEGTAQEIAYSAGRALFNIGSQIWEEGEVGTYAKLSFKEGDSFDVRWAPEGSMDTLVESAARTAGTEGLTEGATLFQEPPAQIILTKEQAAEANEVVKRKQEDAGNLRKLRQIAQGVVMPLERTADSVAGSFVKSALMGTAESLPTMLLAGTPGVGPLILFEAYTADGQARLRESGVPDDKAALLAPVIGMAQAAGDMLQLSLLKKLPGLTGWAQRWGAKTVLPGASPVPLWAKRLALTTIGEIGIEHFQDYTKKMVQDFAAVVFPDVTGTPDENIVEEIWKSSQEMVPSMMLMSAVGTGAATWRDVKGLQALASAPGNGAALRALGFTENHIAAIQSAKSDEMAQLALRAAWPHRVPVAKGDSAGLSTGEAAAVASESISGDGNRAPGEPVTAAQEPPHTAPVSGEPSADLVTAPETAAGNVLLRRGDGPNGWYLVEEDGARTQVGTVEAGLHMRETLRMGQVKQATDAEEAKAQAAAEAYLSIVDSFAVPGKEQTITGASVGVARGGQVTTAAPGANVDTGEGITFSQVPAEDIANLDAQLDHLGADSATINGSNLVRDGVTRIVLNNSTQGVFTVVHENAEAAYKAGKITAAEARAAARAALPLFDVVRPANRRPVSAEQQKADEKMWNVLNKIERGEATAAEQQETLVELAVANEHSRRKDGGKFKPGALTTAVEAAIQRNENPEERKALGKFRAFLRAVRAYMRAVFSTVAKIQKARREGADVEAIDRLTDKLLGYDQDRAQAEAVEGEARETFSLGAAESAPLGGLTEAEGNYRTAVANGDVAMAQALVDQAAKAGGFNTGPVWRGHRKNQSIHETKEDGIHFSSDREYSEVYGINSDDGGFDRDGQVLTRAHLRLEKPLDLRDVGSYAELINRFESVGISLDTPVNLYPWSQAKSFNRAAPLREHLDSVNAEVERRGGWGNPEHFSPNEDVTDHLGRYIKDKVDGIVFFEHNDPRVTSYVVFRPEQIADADPALRSSDGRLVPLKSRFPDIGLIKPNAADLSESGAGGFKSKPEDADKSGIGRAPEAGRDRTGSATQTNAEPSVAATIPPHPASAVNEKATAEDSGITFSLSPGSALDLLADEVAARTTDPKERLASYARAHDTLRGMARAVRFNDSVASAVTRAAIDKERSAMRGKREDELLEEVDRDFGDLSGTEFVASALNNPLMDAIFTKRPGQRFPRSMIQSRSRAERRGMDTGGDYDGAGDLPSWLFGGSVQPDVMAQQLFEDGLLKEPTPDAMWNAIGVALKSAGAAKDRLSQYGQRRAAARVQAKEESEAFADKELAALPKTQEAREKQDMLRFMAALDSLLVVLPAELRSKVGGWTKLASLQTNQARADYIVTRIEKMDRVFEVFLQDKYSGAIEELVEKSAPAREAGEKPKGKLGEEGHRLVDAVAAAIAMTRAAADTEVDRLIAEMEAATDPAAHADLAEQLNIVSRFGSLAKGHSARDLAESLAWLEKNIARERSIWRTQEEARLEEVKGLVVAGIESIGAADMADTMNAKAKGSDPMTATRAAVSSIPGAIRALFGEASAVTKRWRRKLRVAINGFLDDAAKMEREFTGMVRVQFGAGIAGWRKFYDMFQVEKKSGVVVISGGAQRMVKLPAATAQNILDGSAPALAATYSKKALEAMRAALDANTARGTAAGDKTKPLKEISFSQESGGAEKELELTQAEAIRLSLMWGQEQGRGPMEAHGFTEDSIVALDAFLSPQAKAFRAWFSEHYRLEWGPLNEVFARMQGVGLPRIPGYAPLTFKAQGKIDTGGLDPFNGPMMDPGGMGMGMFKTRREKHSAEPALADEFATFFRHMKQVSYFRHFGEILREMRNVLGNVRVQNAIAAKYGKYGTGLSKKLLEILDKGGSIAKSGTEDERYNKMARARAVASLSLNPATVLKQAPAILNLAYRLPAGVFAKGMVKLLAGRLDAGLFAMLKSPTIRRRLDAGSGPELQMALQGLEGRRPNLLTETAHLGLMPLQKSDAFWTAGSAAIAYDYYQGQVRKENPSWAAEAVDAEAVQRLEETLGDVAQPISFLDKSIAEMERGALARLVFMFQSESRQKIALQIEAGGEKNWGVMTKAIVLNGLVGVTMQGIAAMWRDYNDDDDTELFDATHWKLRDFIIAGILGQWGALPVFWGIGIETFAQAVKGVNFDNSLGSDMSKAAHAVQAAFNAATVENKDGELKSKEPVEKIVHAAVGLTNAVSVMVGRGEFGAAARLGGYFFDSVDAAHDDEVEAEAKEKRAKAAAKKEAKEAE